MLQAKAIRIGLWVLYLVLAAVFAEGAESLAAGCDPARRADAWTAIGEADGLGPRREIDAKVRPVATPLARPLEPVPRQPPMLMPYGPLAGARVRTLDWRDAREPAQWKWTPPRPHHACMVRIQVGSAAGSGVYVQWRGGSGRTHRAIMTAEHVVEGSASIVVRWIDGQTSRGIRRTVNVDRYEHDVALFRCDGYHPAVTPIPLANRSPAVGETLEVCGYGTGGYRLRNYYTRVTDTKRYGTDDLAKPGPVHGDSGGGIVTANDRGELSIASVVSAGSQPGQVGGVKAYGTLWYARPKAVQDFARRVATRWESDGGSDDDQCGPRGCPPPDRGGQVFPDQAPYKIGPRSGGPNIDIDLQRPAPRHSAGPSPAVALAVIAVAGVSALLVAFRRRI